MAQASTATTRAGAGTSGGINFDELEAVPIEKLASANLATIDDLLTILDMKQHSRTFNKEEIDLTTLFFLTDAHLVELGMTLSERIKLLRCVQLFKDVPPPPRHLRMNTNATPVQPPPPPRQAPAATASPRSPPSHPSPPPPPPNRTPLPPAQQQDEQDDDESGEQIDDPEEEQNEQNDGENGQEEEDGDEGEGEEEEEDGDGRAPPPLPTEEEADDNDDAAPEQDEEETPPSTSNLFQAPSTVDMDKYRRMTKAGLPEGAVRQAMGRDGVSVADQDAFFAS